MGRNGGRPARYTEGERLDVLARAEAGESDRQIAAAVFGDSRYRGRVERIRRQAAAVVEESVPAPPRIELNLDHEAPPASAAYWREVVSHSRRRLEGRLSQGETVSPRELETLLKLEQRVANLEQFERVRELTRER